MANEPKDSGVSFSQFFDRCKLPSSIKDDCDAFVRSRYSEPVRPAPFQGYCSYTVFVGEETVVQFRPLAHKLDIGITSTACEIFGPLAPETEYIGELEGAGLYVFSMKKIPGVSLADLRAETKLSQGRSQREHVVRDFAHLQAAAWAHARSNENIQNKKTVGSSIRWRLELMAKKLPSRFRGIAKSVLLDLSKIEALPWVLSHGDFLPSNIMVHPKTGKLAGLVDWTEGEFLPFGVGMYGLQELLGEDRDGHFVYYPEAKYLRKLFWAELFSNIPELSRDTRRVALIRKAQILGIFLWHGIAFDNGKLDRAVEEGKDDGEVERLDAFLLSRTGSGPRKLRIIHPFIYSPTGFIRGILFGKA
ncbi:uncharacterized protein GGS22DRAFT_156704 [Annulohypoxylon maeteangense]|uniref:uncharacterized protein n=1 Tax=Annulohypoxylon maeteangense TaxID=1927788 RepID=UPI00200862FB|nr:uncharacterized protein GGS22DRAFT_156704 [Annulohypoxylon maeteangense]KAI0887298.1 hypothetical protein GGS22DRAFT_156704 [Annulohypoxylon maeteangense]